MLALCWRLWAAPGGVGLGQGFSLRWQLVDLNVPEMNGGLKNPTAAEQKRDRL